MFLARKRESRKTGLESENSFFNLGARRKVCTGFAMLIETTTRDYYILCPKYRIETCNYVGCHFLKHPEQIISVWKRGLKKVYRSLNHIPCFNMAPVWNFTFLFNRSYCQKIVNSQRCRLTFSCQEIQKQSMSSTNIECRCVRHCDSVLLGLPLCDVCTCVIIMCFCISEI